jgi:hypothetical protein
VILYYGTDLVGNFSKTQMFDDGAHQDGVANDGVFGAQIPGFAANTLVRYYVEAIANNAALSASYLPVGAEHDIFVYTVAQQNNANGVVVNELLAQNTTDAVDEAGDYEDWVELYNNNEYPVDLSGFYLSDSTTNLTKWQFPSGSIIEANSYMMIWTDDEPTEGPLHATFKLSVSGESVTLSDPSQNIIDQVVFGAQTTNMAYARIPNGTGEFVIQATTFNDNNENALSLNDVAENKDFFILYPNPAKDFVSLNVSEIWIGKQAIIYNTLGQIVQQFELKNENNIDLTSFSKGFYFITSEGKTQKLIVQ